MFQSKGEVVCFEHTTSPGRHGFDNYDFFCLTLHLQPVNTAHTCVIVSIADKLYTVLYLKPTKSCYRVLLELEFIISYDTAVLYVSV